MLKCFFIKKEKKIIQNTIVQPLLKFKTFAYINWRNIYILFNMYLINTLILCIYVYMYNYVIGNVLLRSCSHNGRK